MVAVSSDQCLKDMSMLLPSMVYIIDSFRDNVVLSSRSYIALFNFRTCCESHHGTMVKAGVPFDVATRSRVDGSTESLEEVVVSRGVRRRLGDEGCSSLYRRARQGISVPVSCQLRNELNDSYLGHCSVSGAVTRPLGKRHVEGQ